MIGWKDSDGDGIFDVLDVPFTLTGTGLYDLRAGVYHFTGNSAVQTLPNLNPAGLGNDITINRITRAEVRIDGDPNPWMPLPQVHDSHSATLNLAVPVPAAFQTIEIRTIDARTGVTSVVFVGTPADVPPVSPATPAPSPVSQLTVVLRRVRGRTRVRVLDAASRALRMQFFPFPRSFRGLVRVAVRDVNGDGIPEIVATHRDSSGKEERIFDSHSGKLIQKSRRRFRRRQPAALALIGSPDSILPAAAPLMTESQEGP
jgi:hypothetical protein